MSCPRLVPIVGVLVLLLWHPIESLRATRSLMITSTTTSLFGEDEMVVTASASGFTDGEAIYVKGAFYQSGSTNYFGYTKKGDGSWVKNGETTMSQQSVTIGSWDGTLSVKSDFSDSGFGGEGDYSFKVGFYYTTSGGNLSSVNWSENTLTVTLNEPDPTPTPTPSMTPTPNPTSVPTNTQQSTATAGPTVTAPTKTPTPKATATRSPTLTPIQSGPTTSEAFDILGTSDIATEDATQKVERNPESSGTPPWVFALLFIGIGLGLLAFALALGRVDVWKKFIESSHGGGRHSSG
ncbi:MAG TPA: hypothetical protein VJB96_01370 [Patescibacteria group bacterium]|nr:hypothetical protein [Patescibacteria group bacterium]